MLHLLTKKKQHDDDDDEEETSEKEQRRPICVDSKQCEMDSSDRSEQTDYVKINCNKYSRALSAC